MSCLEMVRRSQFRDGSALLASINWSGRAFFYVQKSFVQLALKFGVIQFSRENKLGGVKSARCRGDPARRLFRFRKFAGYNLAKYIQECVMPTDFKPNGVKKIPRNFVSRLRGILVEVTGFEPATFWSRTKRATKLRYTSGWSR